MNHLLVYFSENATNLSTELHVKRTKPSLSATLVYFLKEKDSSGHITMEIRLKNKLRLTTDSG